MEKHYLYNILAYAVIITIAFQMLLPCVAKSKSLATDQAAILSLKYHTTSNSSISVCSWFGVSALDLSVMSLSGTIPPQLGDLSYLVSLDLSRNDFSGALPQELSLLHRLKFICLSYNSFTGSIPKSLANLTNLQSLDFSYNSLSGQIPQELGRLQVYKL